MIRALPALAVLLLLAGSSAALAQPVPTQPGSRTSAQPPTATQPQTQSGAAQSNRVAAPETPAPAGRHPATGNYWYWIAAIVVIVAFAWGAPRFLRRVKGSSPPRM